MAEWLTKLLSKAKVAFGNYQNDSGQIPVSKGNSTVKFYSKEKDLNMGVSIQSNNDEPDVSGNKRVANSVNQGQNLENLGFKYFANLNNTEGSVTKALSGYSQEVYGKSLNELNEEQYRSVCAAARNFLPKGGLNSPASQLDEHYSIIIEKFNK